MSFNSLVVLTVETMHLRMDCVLLEMSSFTGVLFVISSVMLLLRAKFFVICVRALLPLMDTTDGLVFSFRKSEKFGTDWANGFSGGARRFKELEFAVGVREEDFGIETADGPLGVELERVLLGACFLESALIEEPSADRLSL